MGKYSCVKCAKTFSQKSHYNKHILRKNPCEIQTDKIKELIDKAVDEKLNNLSRTLISNKNEANISINNAEQINNLKMTKKDLLKKCKEMDITKCSSKNKQELIEMINSKNMIEEPNNVTSQSVTSQPVTLKMIDLFAGTGAFTLAFQSTNAVNVVFANDMVAHSKTSYDENFNHTLTLEDLNEVNIVVYQV